MLKEDRILRSFEKISALLEALNPLQDSDKKIGLVPTMGALHAGHIRLVKKAGEECDVVVVTIFVNPTQFNNLEDLEKYPRTPKADLELLSDSGCDIVFLPTVQEVYPPDHKPLSLDLSPLDDVMEGAHRPGHFEGVINVVSRLFDIVRPHRAYFGRKDFQQVAIIKEMKNRLFLPIEIITVETERLESGLAMSSRNVRLSEKGKEEATILFDTLRKGKELAKEMGPGETKRKMLEIFEKGSLELEYLEIVDPDSLLPLNQYWVPGATACIVAYCENVRLIDNMELIPLN
ncbi:MAG: pantoate--beta-alanine ligase [Brumimicrobium sp.]|nr:pantoate--beta-alanine ligase [Brumimicrobium sp.]